MGTSEFPKVFQNPFIKRIVKISHDMISVVLTLATRSFSNTFATLWQKNPHNKSNYVVPSELSFTQGINTATEHDPFLLQIYFFLIGTTEDKDFDSLPFKVIHDEILMCHQIDE